MNKVELIGRLTHDVEMRQTPNGVSLARFSIAVTRRFKNSNGEYDADFINCVAFGKQGEFAEKYLKQGTKIVISGRIQTGSYTNRDGVKVYTTDVVIEEQEFAESKKAAETSSTPQNTQGVKSNPEDDGSVSYTHLTLPTT